jgi:hypothetical protein
LLPSIYQPTDEHMSCNYAVRVDGQLRAVVGLFPMAWQVGDTVLKVGGIGGVSTHSSVRGAGYMKVLMNHCVQVMIEEQYDLSWLGGQRQRYGYFGYEKCGARTRLTLSATNLRHAQQETPITFVPIDAGDDAALMVAQGLHDQQAVFCRRAPEAFHRYLSVGYRRPYLATDTRGAVIGYLVVDDKGGEVVEMVARNQHQLAEIAGAWVRARDDSASFLAMPTSTDLLQQLSPLVEGESVTSSGNWQIFDWEKTVGALLRARALSTSLPDGRVSFGIEEVGTLEIEVTAGQVECRRSTAAAAVIWSAFTAMRVLFGPLPAEAVVHIPPALAALHSWCPLPLGWSQQDYV